MKNVLLDKGIILPSGEISKDKVNLVTGAITQPFAEMVWVTTGGDITHRTGGVSHFPQGRTGTPLFSCPLLRSRQEKALDLCGFAGAVFSG